MSRARDLADGTFSGEFAADSPTLVVDATNNRVGIGTSSPEADLHIKQSGANKNGIKVERTDNTAEYLLLANHNGGSRIASVDENNVGREAVIFERSSNGSTFSESMRITSSGSVGIATSSVATNFRQEIVGFAGSNTGPASSGTTQDVSAVMRIRPGGGFTAALDIGQGGGNGSWLQSTDTTNLATNYPLFLNPNGGNVGIGTTTPAGKLAIGDFSATGADYGVAFVDGNDIFFIRSSTNTSTNNAHYQFYNTNGNVGSITTSGSSTAYNTSSDYRLKENVVALDGAANRLAQIPVHRFNFIADPNTIVDGFLAHEVQAIVPEAVTGTKDGMREEEYEVTPAVPATYDEEGNVLTEAVPAVMGTRTVPDYQGIDQSKLVPLLTAALQEALQKIDALEARIVTLEGGA